MTQPIDSPSDFNSWLSAIPHPLAGVDADWMANLGLEDGPARLLSHLIPDGPRGASRALQALLSIIDRQGWECDGLRNLARLVLHVPFADAAPRCTYEPLSFLFCRAAKLPPDLDQWTLAALPELWEARAMQALERHRSVHAVTDVYHRVLAVRRVLDSLQKQGVVPALPSNGQALQETMWRALQANADLDDARRLDAHARGKGVFLRRTLVPHGEAEVVDFDAICGRPPKHPDLANADAVVPERTREPRRDLGSQLSTTSLLALRDLPPVSPALGLEILRGSFLHLNGPRKPQAFALLARLTLSGETAAASVAHGPFSAEDERLAAEAVLQMVKQELHLRWSPTLNDLALIGHPLLIQAYLQGEDYERDVERLDYQLHYDRCGRPLPDARPEPLLRDRIRWAEERERFITPDEYAVLGDQILSKQAVEFEHYLDVSFTSPAATQRLVEWYAWLYLCMGGLSDALVRLLPPETFLEAAATRRTKVPQPDARQVRDIGRALSRALDSISPRLDVAAVDRINRAAAAFDLLAVLGLRANLELGNVRTEHFDTGAGQLLIPKTKYYSEGRVVPLTRDQRAFFQGLLQMRRERGGGHLLSVPGSSKRPAPGVIYRDLMAVAREHGYRGADIDIALHRHAALTAQNEVTRGRPLFFMVKTGLAGHNRWLFSPICDLLWSELVETCEPLWNRRLEDVGLTTCTRYADVTGLGLAA